MMTIGTENYLKPAAAAEATGIYLFGSMFFKMETINTVFFKLIEICRRASLSPPPAPRGWTTLISCQLCECLLLKEEQKEAENQKQHAQWCAHMPRWSFLHVDRGSALTPQAIWGGAFTHLHCWTLARGQMLLLGFFFFIWSSFLL